MKRPLALTAFVISLSASVATSQAEPDFWDTRHADLGNVELTPEAQSFLVSVDADDDLLDNSPYFELTLQADVDGEGEITVEFQVDDEEPSVWECVVNPATSEADDAEPLPELYCPALPFGEMDDGAPGVITILLSAPEGDVLLRAAGVQVTGSASTVPADGGSFSISID